mgnify:CR=1 FL=1
MKGCFKLVLNLALIVVCGFVLFGALESFMTPEEELVVNVTDLQIKLVSLSYDDLARYPDQHKGKAVSYQGKVIQKVSDTGLRIGTKEGSYGSWDDVFYVRLKNEAKDVGILEGDIVEFIGMTDGEQKATTIFGQRVALPRINVYGIKVIEKRQ